MIADAYAFRGSRQRSFFVQKNFARDLGNTFDNNQTRAALGERLSKKVKKKMKDANSPSPETPPGETPSAVLGQLEDGARLPASAARTPTTSPASDILYGADAVAEFLFGDGKYRRRVYNLVENDGVPVFRIGINICARKSVLLAWIEAQERSFGPNRP